MRRSLIFVLVAGACGTDAAPAPVGPPDMRPQSLRAHQAALVVIGRQPQCGRLQRGRQKKE
jgi:hypothetical protein